MRVHRNWCGMEVHKQIIAVASTILTIGYRMLNSGAAHHELGGDYFDKHNTLRTTRRLVKRLEALGYRITLEPASTTLLSQPSQ